jgi:ribosomal protein S18
VCKFCQENRDTIDYKDVVCAPHQRQLRVAIKRARNIALLPFAVEI